jgi:cytochrome c biogenesis protein CcmG/thiol:disulfide interchange protein DsbE
MNRLRWTLWIVLAATVALFGLFALQLTKPKDDFVRSAMIGHQVPQFALDAATESRPGLANTDFADGKPRLLNVFASWCVPCVAEAPQLAALEREGANIVAIAIRDRPDDVARFLETNGNPFSRIGADPLSQVQFSLGSSGVPETFVVDGKGVIRYQHLGEIRASDVPLLLAHLREAGA